MLVIDEADKLFHKGTTSWADTGLISELLKFTEGGSYNIGTTVKPRHIDTTRFTVILLGSFSSLTDHNPSHAIGFNADIISNSSSHIMLKKEQIVGQLPPELQGRISQVVILDNFTEDDYYNILTDEHYSPVVRLSREYGLNLSIFDENFHEIAREGTLLIQACAR